MSLKAFRLFVSSTFADFKLEREVLQNQVFPQINAYCAAKGYQFYPLDLRWGVSEEAQLDQRTSEICLGEARAALDYPPPNFLIMLGNRYGWVPLPSSIAADEFEAIVSFLDERDQQKAVQGLRFVYERDDNHLVPPSLVKAGVVDDMRVSAYRLRSREDMRRLRSAEQWEKAERFLRQALQKAARGLLALGRISVVAHEKYFTSLTEHEIRLALANKHAAAADHNGPAAIAFIREIANGTTKNPLLIEQEPRLVALKGAVKGALRKEHVLTANATLTRNGELTGAHLNAFATEIERRLKAAIERHIAWVEALERSPNFVLESERATHRAFAAQRLKVFVGRDNNLAAIERYLDGESKQPLVLYGRSGLGKSALMARAVKAAEETANAPVIARFAGASAASSNLRSLLLSVVNDLAALGLVTKPEEFEEDTNKFNGQIRLLLASIGKPVVIFLDALDQLQTPKSLGWLPRQLPPRLKLVLSVLCDPAYEADSDVCRSLMRRLAPGAFLEIEPLLPSQGRKILLSLERESRCSLQRSQRDYVISQFELAGASPLYLKTAFEITKSWKSTAQAGDGRHVLAPNTSALIAQFIDELSSVHHHEPDLVARTLGFLTAAKNGLSESELSQVLSGDERVMGAISSEKHGAHTDKLPPSVWVRLHRDLSPFLVQKLIDDQPLLQFFHRQVAQVARKRYYDTVKVELHGRLATYFGMQATRQGDRAIYGKRSLAELPYQLHFANETGRLDQILESPDWIEQKFDAFGTNPLVRDYEQFGRSELQQLIGRALKVSSGICVRDRRQLLPQLHGRLLSETAAGVFCKKAQRFIKPPALATTRPSLAQPGAEAGRLDGHEHRPSTLLVVPDGRLASCGGDNTIRLWDLTCDMESARLEGHEDLVLDLALLQDGRVASCSGDNTIRLWDLSTCTVSACLKGHWRWVRKLAALSNGHLASAVDDETIRFWDTRRGVEYACVECSTQELAALPNGRLVSSEGVDRETIKLWDVADGSEVARFQGWDFITLADGRLLYWPGYSDPDKRCRLVDTDRGVEIARLIAPDTGKLMKELPDGRIALLRSDTLEDGGAEYYVLLWDWAGGGPTVRLAGHGRYSWLWVITMLPDGRVVTGTDDRTIRMWDAQNGIEINCLTGLEDTVTLLMPLPDGRLASTCSGSGVIRLWDVAARAEKNRLEKHEGPIYALTLLPDGRLASAAEDHTIRIWDPASGAQTACLTGHKNRINALAVIEDGRLASGSRDKTIRLWNVQTKEETARLTGHEGWVTALVALPGGNLASGASSMADDVMYHLALEQGSKPRHFRASYDYAARIWDTAIGFETRRLEGHTSDIMALTLLPDDRLASGSVDKTIRIWDLTTGASVARLEGHEHYVTALVCLPGGRLASASEDGTVRVWDTKAGIETFRLQGHGGKVRALALLSTGHIASGSDDKTIRIWDAAAGAEITRLEVDAPVLSLAALPGSAVVAGDAAGRLHWLEFADAARPRPQQVIKEASLMPRWLSRKR